MDSSAIYVTVASNDPSIAFGDTAVSFSNFLPYPVMLSGADWEVALFNVTFAPAAGTQTVMVNSSLVEETVVVGSQRTNALRRILVSVGGSAMLWETPSQLQWVPASVSDALARIEVSLTNEVGDPIVAVPGSITFVTIALRPQLIRKFR
jgi:hypothetical protein